MPQIMSFNIKIFKQESLLFRIHLRSTCFKNNFIIILPNQIYKWMLKNAFWSSSWWRLTFSFKSTFTEKKQSGKGQKEGGSAL